MIRQFVMRLVPFIFVATVAEPSPWVQDRFVISMCTDPIVTPDQFDMRWGEIAEANFTVVVSGAWLTPRSARAWTPAERLANAELQMEVAEKHNLSVIMALFAPHFDNTSGAFTPPLSPSMLDSTSPNLWGFQLTDEPAGSAMFSLLARFRKAIEAARPAQPTLSFANLLPNYGMDAEWGPGASGYQRYVDTYIATFNPQVLCFDHYPWFEIGDSPPFTPPTFAYPLNSRDGYRQNLMTIRNASLRHNIPFWNYFNTIPFQGHRDPSFGELSWQAFTSLAFGAKGVLWFTYWDDPDGVHFGYGNSVITRRALPGTYNESDGPTYGANADYVKGPHWYHAKQINSKLLALGGWLLHANSTSVLEIGGAVTSGTPSAANTAIPGPIVAALSGTDIIGAAGHYLVGQFLLPDGRPAVILQNQDPYMTAWPTITFAAGVDVTKGMVLEVDPIHGTAAYLLDDSPLQKGLQLGLEPGDARLLIGDFKLACSQS